MNNKKKLLRFKEKKPRTLGSKLHTNASPQGPYET